METRFILVFRPHQRPAWAEAFDHEQEFVDDFLQGCYEKNCFASGEEYDERPTYDEVVEEVSHDLSSLTRLDSADEVRRYVDERDYCGQHNKGLDTVHACAVELGWAEDEDEEEDEDE